MFRFVAAACRRSFHLFSRFGVHITPVHFDSPIPDIRECEFKVSEMRGVDMNESAQLEMLSRIASVREELRSIPLTATEYSLCRTNNMFGVLDSAMLYAMVRCAKPHRIIEIGSGYSTLISIKAASQNPEPCEITCIEPYPRPSMSGLPIRLIKDRVQTVSLREFESLEPNDILFIDSSHVLKTGSDVTYEFLEILPRLKLGVIVHVHDIFFPEDYPVHWLKEQRFWNEQYALQLFLEFNKHFSVLWAANYMRLKYPQRLVETIPDYTLTDVGGSFWMQS